MATTLQDRELNHHGNNLIGFIILLMPILREMELFMPDSGGGYYNTRIGVVHERYHC